MALQLNRKFVAVALLGFILPFGVEASESVESLNPLYAALPADRFIAVDGWERIRSADLSLSRVTGIFIGLSAGGEKLGAVVHVVTAGYGGNIALLVAFDAEGRILRVPVIKHQETVCHVPGLVDGAFLAQFPGLGLADKIRLMIGQKKEKKGEVDAMSGGTVSSRALTEGIAEARIAFYRARAEGLIRLP